MADVLQDLPPGYREGIDCMNKLPIEILSDICHNVLCYLQFKIPAIRIEDLKEKCEQCNIDIKEEDLLSIISVLKYIYRSASKHKLDNTLLQQQLSSSLSFSETCIQCISENWKEKGNNMLQENSCPLFDVGKLVDMQWKLGVAVSSDSCKNLNSSFVTMTIKVADSSGKLSTHAFEMDIPQFKNLSRQLQDMAKNMEMI